MNEYEYQRMLNHAKQAEILGGGTWAERTTPGIAKTRYPNILAELNGSPYYLWVFAGHARVSKEIMVAVMQDNEELAISEGIGLARVLECGLGYLVAPTMQMVNPSTNKGKRRRRELHDLIRAADGRKVWMRWAVERVQGNLDAGKPVTYASWRWACHNLKEALENNKPHCVRTTRMEAAV